MVDTFNKYLNYLNGNIAIFPDLRHNSNQNVTGNYSKSFEYKTTAPINIIDWHDFQCILYSKVFFVELVLCSLHILFDLFLVKSPLGNNYELESRNLWAWK